MKTQSALRLNSFQTQVSLGWSEKEREVPQEVLFSVEILFSQPPKGCETDTLDETICYDKVSRILKKVSQEKSYKLIEHLAYQAFNEVSGLLSPGISLKITVKKTNPPIEGLKGGTEFILEGTPT